MGIGEKDRGREAASRDQKRRTEAKLRSIVDPLRRDVYWALRAQPATAVEVAAGLGVAVEKVRSQIRSMRKAGIVEAVGDTRRRGVAEVLFQVCDREMMISAAELSTARPAVVEHSHLASIARMWKEVRVHPGPGLRGVAPEFAHATKVDLLLDGRGWAEALLVLTDAAAEIKAARDRRSKEGEEPPEEHRVSLVLFETIFPDPEVGPCSPTSTSEQGVRSGTRKPLGSRQLEIVKLLTFRPASTVELADRLQLPAHAVKSDLRSLRAAGLVFVCEERARRNTIENLYTVGFRRREETLDDLNGASPRRLLEHYDAVTRSACRDLVEAVKAGVLRKRTDHVLMRIPLPADPGLIDLSAGILRRAFAATLRLGGESRSRLRASGETPTCAQSTILSSTTAP